MTDNDNSLLDPNEHKYFTEFLDNLIDMNDAFYPVADFKYPVFGDPFQQMFPPEIGSQILQPKFAAIPMPVQVQLPHVQPAALPALKRPLIDSDNIKPESPSSAPPAKRKAGRPRKNPLPSVQLDENTSTKTRELLTEDEKRVNHVYSEQRRRNLIRIGFQNLVDITPVLAQSSGGGSGTHTGQHSKSHILEKSAEYIIHLKGQVMQLQRQLQASNGHMQTCPNVILSNPSFQPLQGP